MARSLPWFVLLTACATTASAPVSTVPVLAWGGLEEGIARAAAEDRPLLLSIQADWCHWCHVMNETTYRDPEVRALLEARFVVVREEADARPDLAERYAEYGWPATVIFDAHGVQRVALRGHRDRAALLRVLRDVLDGALPPPAPPSPRASVALEVLRTRLTAQLDDQYDEAREGWGTPQKYPFEAPVEHAFFRARVRPAESEWSDRALRTLAMESALLDPVWGGMYQYSEGGDWAHPHYERIASVQAGALEGFALALRRTGDAIWRDRASEVLRFVRGFLREADGAFGASMDADQRAADASTMPGRDYAALDDTARRARGLPAIDARVYASTNGALITALARLAEVAPELDTLADAERAAERLLRTHRDDDGLFRHEEGEGRARFLADQVAMARALFALHQATGDARWLAEARAATAAMLRTFEAPGGGLYADAHVEGSVGTLAERRVPPTENALAATLLLALHALDEDDARRARALALLEAIADPAALAPMGRKVGEILLALEVAELGLVRLTIVGPADDPRTLALLTAARALDEPLRVLEVDAPGEGRYPYPDAPAVFVCGGGACSMPCFEPDALAADVRRFLAREPID